MLSQWNEVKYKTKSIISNFGDGINTFHPPFDIKDSQASDSRNLSSRNYPALRPREGRSKILTLTGSPSALGKKLDSFLVYIDGTDLKYYSLQTGVSTTVQEDISGTAGLLGRFDESEDYVFYMNSGGTENKYWYGSTVSDLTLLSDSSSSIFATHKKRLFVNTISAGIAYSKIDDITSSQGAITGLTDIKGAITGMCEFNNKLLVFGNEALVEGYNLGGEVATTWEFITYAGKIGCSSNRSLCKCGTRLYWYWNDGIYEYDGGSIYKISEPTGGNGVYGGVTSFIKNINQSYKTIVTSASIGEYLYISIPYGSSVTQNNLTLVFNTKLRTWEVETGGYMALQEVGNNLYALDYDGVIWKLKNGTTDNGTAISWYFISKCFNDGAISQKKVISNLWFTLDLPTGSTLSIYTSTSVDNDDFTLRYTFTADVDEQNTRVILPLTALQNIDWYRIKLSGTGDCTIHFMEKVLRIKT